MGFISRFKSALPAYLLSFVTLASSVFANPRNDYPFQMSSYDKYGQLSFKKANLEDILSKIEKGSKVQNNIFDDKDEIYSKITSAAEKTDNPHKTFNYLLGIYVSDENRFDEFAALLKKNKNDYFKTVNDMLNGIGSRGETFPGIINSNYSLDATQLIYDHSQIFKNPFTPQETKNKVSVPRVNSDFSVARKTSSGSDGGQIYPVDINPAGALITNVYSVADSASSAAKPISEDAVKIVTNNMYDVYSYLLDNTSVPNLKNVDDVTRAVEESLREFFQKEVQKPENKNKPAPKEFELPFFGLGKTLVLNDVNEVTSEYGTRFNGKDEHEGTDIIDGDYKIHPSGDGVVLYTGKNSVSGNFIIIMHAKDLYTGYCHLRSKPKFSRGQKVTTKDVIGIMGNTGHVVKSKYGDGTHLHYLVKRGSSYEGGRFVNPRTVTKFNFNHRTQNR